MTTAVQPAPAQPAKTSQPQADPYGLDRLDFQLPEFTRISWVNDAARDAWEPRIARIGQAWGEIEWRAVIAGERRCSVTMVAPERLPARAGHFARHGLSTLPVEIQGIVNYSYANTTVKPTLGGPFAYRIVVGTPADVADFQSAWEAGDQEAIGDLLGYPPCCREFFHQLWVEHGLRDTTWAMALGSSKEPPAAGVRSLEVAGPPEANILWRWMGVRAVSHLPCSFSCQATAEIGAKNLEIGREAGHEEEMDWMREILSWPVQWSALHGIAEIKTPVLKVSATTDTTATKYVVRRPGQSYPEEGAKGLHFPYRLPHPPKVRQSTAYREGLANPLKILNSKD